MSSPEDVASLSREDLVALVSELQYQVMMLQEDALRTNQVADFYY